MGPVGLVIYPSEDFNFVNLVQLSDLILDLLCIHFKYTDYGGYGYNRPLIPFFNIFLGAWGTGNTAPKCLLPVFTDTDTDTS
jgi:hypothetical protein